MKYGVVFPIGNPRTAADFARAAENAGWDGFIVNTSDAVFADDDGVLFVPWNKIEEILETAKSISSLERQQAESIQAGKKLSEQLDFDRYLTKRTSDPSYTFRRHLKERGGAIEE
jgi:hypothetical protein